MCLKIGQSESQFSYNGCDMPSFVI